MNFSHYPQEYLRMELYRINQLLPITIEKDDVEELSDVRYNIYSELYKRYTGLENPTYRSLNFLSFMMGMQ